MMNWKNAILVLAAFSGPIGCSVEEPPESRARTQKAVVLPPGCDMGICQVSVKVTSGADLSQFAIVAKQNVRLANRSSVEHRSGNPAAVLSSEGNVLVAGYSIAGDVLAASELSVEGGALLRGMGYSGGAVNVQHGARVLGGEHEHQPFYLKDVIVVAPFAMPTSFAPGINLEPDASDSAGPGAYEQWNIKSRATLSLEAGDYFVRNLFLEPQGKLGLANDEGTLQIHVLENLNCKGALDKASGSSNVRIVYWGTNTANIECDLPDIQLIAPNAQIRVADRKSVGKLLGKSVELGVEAEAITSSFQPFTSGPGDKLLKDLTNQEQAASCEAIKAKYLTPEYREVTCRVRGHMAIIQAKPNTDSEARSVCADAYADCMSADPCDGFVESVFDECEVTLAERDECLANYIPALQHADARAKSCSETALYGTLAYRPNPITVPPVCAGYLSCLKGDL